MTASHEHMYIHTHGHTHYLYSKFTTTATGGDRPSTLDTEDLYGVDPIFFSIKYTVGLYTADWQDILEEAMRFLSKNKEIQKEK